MYYLKVTNNTASPQFFHIYEDWGARVTFQSPDPSYTLGAPSEADGAISVGAYTTRQNW
jgi:hypothetical protein